MNDNHIAIDHPSRFTVVSLLTAAAKHASLDELAEEDGVDVVLLAQQRLRAWSLRLPRQSMSRKVIMQLCP